MRLAALLCALCLAAPASANFLVEPTFEQAMEKSDLVVIGTVTEVTELGGDGLSRSTATLSVSHRLKGESPDAITVRTDSRIAEAATNCCTKGASYIMFLIRSPTTGELFSVWGRYGMVRIGGPQFRIVVTRCRDARRRGPAHDQGRRAECE